MRLKKVCNYFAAMFFLVFFTAGLYADVPHQINYQGRLLDSGGNPVNSATEMTFSFYDSETGGSQIPGFSEPRTGIDAVPVSNGIFNVLIGSRTDGGIPASIFSGTTVYVNVYVGGDNLTPRPRVVSVGYAYQADKLDGHDYDYFVDTATAQTISGAKTFTPTITFSTATFSGRVGIGVTSPSDLFHLRAAGGIIQRFTSDESSVEYGLVANSIGFGLYDRTNSLWRLLVSSNGNVGIGTTSPIAKLNLPYGTDYKNGLIFGSGSPYIGMDLWYDNGGYTSSYIESRYNSDSAAMYFRMKASGTPVNAMTILGNGNVGIGTTAPTHLLHVRGAVTGDFLSEIESTNNYGLYIKTAGTTSSHDQLKIDDNSGTVFGVYGGGATYIKGNVGIGTTPGSDKLYVNGNGYVYNEFRVRDGISGDSFECSGGRVKVAYMPPDGTAAAYINGSGQLATSSSSRRFKRDIKSSEEVLENVLKLRPVSFKLNKDLDPTGKTNLGFIAEEMVNIFPEVVNLDKEGKPYNIRYDELVSVCIKAIQEQQKEIDNLKMEIQKLKK